MAKAPNITSQEAQKSPIGVEVKTNTKLVDDNKPAPDAEVLEGDDLLGDEQEDEDLTPKKLSGKRALFGKYRNRYEEK